MIKKNKNIKVFYDGKCNLCSKEINYYKKIATTNIFVWIDIASNPQHLKKFNITQVDALKKIHVVDYDNSIKIGVDAFIVIWEKLNYWKIIAFITKLFPIKILANLLYEKFANYRFSKLEHCKIALDNKS